MKGITRERMVRLKILLYKSILIGFIVVVVSTLVILSGIRELAYRTVYIAHRGDEIEEVAPFPLSVDPERKLIYENPALESYLTTYATTSLAVRIVESNWFTRTLSILARLNWYQNFASPSTKILVIQSGERKEQVATNFGDILGWSPEERREFLERLERTKPYLKEGVLYPDTYTVSRTAKPQEVAKLVLDNFNETVLSRYTEEVEAIVPIEQALIIASLLEREAYDFEDMRHIAGIIWNRLFMGMNLQLDASLQYAKAGPTNWWPRVVPRDKYIESPYNTYEHSGLPPTAIASPSIEAVIAALNPVITECIFYFHDSKGGFHCSKTYEEHVALLKQHYGRGR